MAKEIDNINKEDRRKFDRGVISKNKNSSSSEFLDFDKLKSIISSKNAPKTGIDMWFTQQQQQEEARQKKVADKRK